MAQGSSSGTALPLVYPQVQGPGFVRWFMACWIGLIGGALVVFPIMAIPSAVQGKFQGPPAVLGGFLLLGLGAVTAAVAIVLHRHCIVIDPQTRTVTRRQSWGPVTRTLVLADEVSSVRLMHDTYRSRNNDGGSFTVCQLKVLTRRGELWQLSQRPKAGEAMRQMLPSFLRRTAPDYEQLLRDEAVKLCAATGWRLDDRLERSATGFVPAASAPRAQKVEGIEPLIDTPAWLQRSAPRRVRRRGQTVLLSVLGWGFIVVPLVATAIWAGALYWDARSMRTTSGQVISLAHDGRGLYGVGYRFALNDREYTQWEWNVPAALWAAAQKRGPIQVSYLPCDPYHSNLGPPPPLELLPQDWITKGMKLIPYFLVAIAIALGMRRRGKRIARAMLLGERGRVSQGMVFRRAQKAGRMRASMSLAMNGVAVYKRRPSAEDDPNQVRYEFIVDGKKQFGYVPADLLGIFRPDGLVGVVYDPLCPEVHLPLPVVERYLTFE